MLVFAAAVLVVVVTLHAGAILPFLLVSAMAGVAQGASNSGGMRAVLTHVSQNERAGTLATLYLISYGGGAVPGLIAGQLSHSLALADVATCYAVLVLLMVAISLVASRRAGLPPQHASNK